MMMTMMMNIAGLTKYSKHVGLHVGVYNSFTWDENTGVTIASYAIWYTCNTCLKPLSIIDYYRQHDKVDTRQTLFPEVGQLY